MKPRWYSLTPADYRLVLETVRRVHACRTIPALSSAGVTALLELIPADAMVLQLLRLNGQPLVMISSPGWPYTREQVAYYQKHAALHPMVNYYATHGAGYALRMSDAISPAALARNPIYVHCLKPHGLRHTLAILLDAAPGRQTGISFDRRARDFSRREVALLDALGPHLAQTLEHLELDSGRRRPWREPSTRDWLAGDLGVSNREAEALLHLTEGKSNPAIAAALGVTVPTLKKHLQNAYAKIGVTSRHAAARLVMERLGRF